MYMKMTRLARAGKCGALGASGFTAAASASRVERPEKAVKPNPQERVCNIWRRFIMSGQLLYRNSALANSAWYKRLHVVLSSPEFKNSSDRLSSSAEGERPNVSR